MRFNNKGERKRNFKRWVQNNDVLMRNIHTPTDNSKETGSKGKKAKSMKKYLYFKENTNVKNTDLFIHSQRKQRQERMSSNFQVG